MPCYEPDWLPNNSVSDTKYKRATDQIQLLTRMLCGLCRVLEKKTVLDKEFIKGVKGLPEWWEHHKEQDRKREAEEAKRKREFKDIDKAEYERLRKKLGIKNV